MKRTILIAFVFLVGCNTAASLSVQRGFEVAVAVGFPADQVMLSGGHYQQQSEEVKSIEEKGPGTFHTELSAAELNAKASANIIFYGIVFLVGGVVYWVCRKKWPVLPTYGSTILVKIGACLVAWGGAPPSFRGWIVAAIVAVGGFIMVRRSLQHNKEKEKGNGKEKVKK